MPTITVRKLPPDVIARIKSVAAGIGRSMEEEVRALLLERYPERAVVLERMRERRRRMQPMPREQAEAIMDEVGRRGERPEQDPS